MAGTSGDSREQKTVQRQDIECWFPTTPREKLIKTGTKMVGRVRHGTFQMAGVVSARVSPIAPVVALADSRTMSEPSTEATPGTAPRSAEEGLRENISVARGALFVIVAYALFPSSDAIAKHLTARLDVVQIIWAVFVFQALIIVPAMLVRHGPGLLKTRRPGLQAVRALITVVSTLLYIEALSFVALADAVAILMVTPLMVVALSVPLLGERVGVRRWGAVVAGLVGALIIIRPGLGVVHWASLLVLAAALLFALFQIATRSLSFTDRPETTLVYVSGGAAIAASAVVPFTWPAPELELELWGWLALAGVLSGGAHFAMIKALKLASPSVLAPFVYTELIAATIIGYLFFSDFPDAWTWLGAVVIVLSGLYVLRRQSGDVDRK